MTQQLSVAPVDRSLEGWLSALWETADEFAQCSLAISGIQVAEQELDLRQSILGAYVGLLGPNAACEIGLLASWDGCRELARRMLGIDEDGEGLEDEVVVDTVGEIVNILAGGVKSRRVEPCGPLALGLPLIVTGFPRPTERQQLLKANGLFEAIPVQLMVVGARQ